MWKRGKGTRAGCYLSLLSLSLVSFTSQQTGPAPTMHRMWHRLLFSVMPKGSWERSPTYLQRSTTENERCVRGFHLHCDAPHVPVSSQLDDFSHRDRIYLQILINDTLVKEQTLMEEKTSECSRDTPSEKVLAHLDSTTFPVSLSIMSFEELREVYANSHDLFEAIAMAENNALRNTISTKGEDEETKGIVLVMLIPWGNRPRADVQWLGFCPLHDLGCFQLLQEPIFVDSLILTR